MTISSPSIESHLQLFANQKRFYNFKKTDIMGESQKEQVINRLKEIDDPAIFEKVTNLLDQEKKNAEKATTQFFIDEFGKYQGRQGFEHDLINRRVTWLLT